MTPLSSPTGRFHRIDETERGAVTLEVDGEPVEALEGDTVLTALLTTRGHLRRTEWAQAPRAGFCLMGACQDCWIWTCTGGRIRACSTLVRPGLRLRTRSPFDSWRLPASS